MKLGLFNETKERIGLEIDNLVLTVTDNCNMDCDHCLRGASVGDSTKLGKYLVDIIEWCDRIDQITLTGGEPTLAVDNIKLIYNAVKAKGFDRLPSFYIVTNGLIYSEKMIQTLDEWYFDFLKQELEPIPKFVSDGSLKELCHKVVDAHGFESCGLTISSDVYHEAIPGENVLKYGLSPYFRNDKHYGDYNEGASLLNTGNANFNGLGRRDPGSFDICIDYADIDGCQAIVVSELCVGSTGTICGSCNLSNTDQLECSICNVSDGLDTLLEKLQDHYRGTI